MRFMLLDGNNINILIALLAGFVTFFASCLLPLVPIYLAYLTGLTHRNLSSKNNRLKIIEHSFLFVLGFIAVFVILGLGAVQFGHLTNQYKPVIQKFSGLLLISLSLLMLGLIKLPFLTIERKLPIPKFHLSWLKSLTTGAIFGFAWTPCIGPVLGVILVMASQTDSFLTGTLLLIAYGLGLGIPFLVIGWFFEKLSPQLTSWQKYGHYLNVIAALIILMAGLLMFFDLINSFTFWMLDWLNLNSIAA